MSRTCRRQADLPQKSRLPSNLSLPRFWHTRVLDRWGSASSFDWDHTSSCSSQCFSCALAFFSLTEYFLQLPYFDLRDRQIFSLILLVLLRDVIYMTTELMSRVSRRLHTEYSSDALSSIEDCVFQSFLYHDGSDRDNVSRLRRSISVRRWRRKCFLQRNTLTKMTHTRRSAVWCKIPSDSWPCHIK